MSSCLLHKFSKSWFNWFILYIKVNYVKLSCPYRSLTNPGLTGSFCISRRIMSSCLVHMFNKSWFNWFILYNKVNYVKFILYISSCLVHLFNKSLLILFILYINVNSVNDRVFLFHYQLQMSPLSV